MSWRGLRLYKLDENQEPIPVDYVEWDSASANWVIQQDHIDESFVSTVFLGADLSCGFTPALFETMIFGGPMDGKQCRYATRAEALAGHEEILTCIRKLKEE